MRHTRPALALGTLAIIAACNFVSAEPITTMPDSAYVMIKVNNLEKTSGKIGKLCEQWGIAALQPQAADPLGSVMKLAKIQQGVQKDGELGIAIMPGMGQPNVLVMIPVTDYKAFLANFPEATADGAVSSFILPENGMQAFVTQSGSYALLSMDRGTVAKAPASSPFPAITGKEMASRDVAVYVNFRSFRQQALQGVNMIKGMVLEQITQKATAQGPERKALAPVIRAAAGQYVTAFTRIVSDTRGLSYGLSLSEQGVQITTVAEFEPDSYLATFSGQLKGTSENLTAGLPASKYLLLGGMSFSDGAFTRLIDDAAKPVVAEAAKLGDTGKPIVDAVEAMKTFATTAKNYSFAAAASDAKVGEAPLMNGIGVVQGDATALLATQRKMVQSQAALIDVMDAEGTGAVKTSLKQASQTVGGVSFDEFTAKLDVKNPQGPDVAMQKLLYGPEGMIGKVGIINPQTLLVAQSVDDATLAKAVEAAKTRSDAALTADMKAVAARLPKTRLAECYISLENGAAAISKVAEAVTGSPLPIQLPEGQPPIGVTLSSQPGALQTDVYLPSAVIQNIIGAGMQAYMNATLKDDGGL